MKQVCERNQRVFADKSLAIKACTDFAQPSQIMKIAYYMKEVKLGRLNWDQFVKLARESGHECTWVDFSKAPCLEPGFDVILSKMTDDLAHLGEPVSDFALKNFESFLENNPTILQIDPL